MFSAIRMDKRQLLALCLCGVMVTFQGTVTVKLLPVYAVQMGADPTTTGLLVAFAFLAVTVGNICGGWLSDWLGVRKPVLLISLGIWIPAALLMTQATTIPWLILTTGILWLPGGLVLAMISIITALSTVKEERGQVFGVQALASGIGALLAGAFGGVIAERWGFPLLFAVMAALDALMLLIAIFIQDKPLPREGDQPQTGDGKLVGKKVSIGQLVPLLLAAHLLVRLSLLASDLGIPLAMTHLGFTAAAVSSAVAVSAAVTFPLPLLLGWLSDKAGRKRLLLLCYGIGALGLFVLASSTGIWHFWLAASLVAMGAAGNGVAKAFVADLAPPQAIGRSMSLFDSTSLFAGIIGLSGGGYMMQTLGIRSALLLGVCLPLMAMALLLRMRVPAPVPSSDAVAHVQA
jgi:MFS transporter, DHA1 family, multidrug resistance protein